MSIVRNFKMYALSNIRGQIGAELQSAFINSGPHKGRQIYEHLEGRYVTGPAVELNYSIGTWMWGTDRSDMWFVGNVTQEPPRVVVPNDINPSICGTFFMISYDMTKPDTPTMRDMCVSPVICVPNMADHWETMLAELA